MFLLEAEPGQDSVTVNLRRQRAQGPRTVRTVLRVPGSVTNSSNNINSSNINSSSNSNNQRAAVRPVYSATWRISARTSQLWACSISTNRQLTCARPTSHFKAGLGNELSEEAERHLPVSLRNINQNGDRKTLSKRFINLSGCKQLTVVRMGSFARRWKDSCRAYGNGISD
jgi:hypothetical protein